MVRAVSIAVLLLLCFILGTCYAEENTGYLTYIQGGTSVISEGMNDTMILIMNDTIPYYSIHIGDRNFLMPLANESLYELPINAALILNGVDGEAGYLVKIISWSFDPDKNELNLEIRPAEFYEGGLLREFANEKMEISGDNGVTGLSTGLYLEIMRVTPENPIPRPRPHTPESYNEWCYSTPGCSGAY